MCYGVFSLCSLVERTFRSALLVAFSMLNCQPRRGGGIIYDRGKGGQDSPLSNIDTPLLLRTLNLISRF
jgi:hypothetical protein